MTARARVAALLVPLLSTPLVGVVGAPAAHAERITPGELPGYWAEVAVVQALPEHYDDVPLTGELVVSAARSRSAPGRVGAALEAIEARAEAEWYGRASATDVGALASLVTTLTDLTSDTRSFGGVDLLRRLDSTVTTSGRVDGGAVVADVEDQALAALALLTTNSPRAGSAIDYLRGLQCADGSFPRELPAAGAVQACDPATATPDVRATARASVLLEAAGGEAARRWLAEVQGDDGGFTRTGRPGAAETESTALAAEFLGGPSGDAAQLWLRAVQGALSGPCRYPGDGFVPLGLVAPSASAFDAAVRGGIPRAEERAWLRVTALAAPVMRAVRAGESRSFALEVPRGYQPAGTLMGVDMTGLPASSQVCVTLGNRSWLARADETGRANLSVRLPSDRRLVHLQPHLYDTQLGEGRDLRLLGSTRFGVRVRDRVVVRGARQQVRVTGLARHEGLSIDYRNRTVARGRATAAGTFVASFNVGAGPVGRATLFVRGLFGKRVGRASFSVGR